MSYRWSLTNKSIRKNKPGFSDNYYKIVESLDKYIKAIVDKLRLEICNAKRLAGESNVNVLLETKSKDRFIVRISPWKNELLTSSIFYNILTENKIPSPKVVDYDISFEIIPFEFQVITYIENDKKLTDRCVEATGNAYGRVLRTIHSIKTNGFGQPESRDKWIDKSWADALNRVYITSSFLRAKTKMYSKAEIRKIESYFTKSNLSISQPSLIHGDVGINNVLFRVSATNITVAAVIDPGSLISGDPMLDIAMLLNDDDKFSDATVQSYDLSELKDVERFRMSILRLMCSYWASCYFFSVKKKYNRYVNLTRKLLGNLE